MGTCAEAAEDVVSATGERGRAKRTARSSLRREGGVVSSRSMQILRSVLMSMTAATLVSVVVVVVVAGATADWGMTRAGNAMFGVMIAQTLIFLFTSIVAFRRAAGTPRQGAIAVVLHLLLSVPVGGAIVMANFVLFNR